MNRFIKAGLTLVASAVLAVSTAHAADWKPSGPIKMMIGFAAGGGADTQARLIAEAIEKKHGWKIIPEQVTGKGGINLAKALKDSPKDGTAIGMIVTETLGYNMLAAKKSGVQLSDFTPLTTTAGFQMGVVAKSEKGWKTMEDVFKAAKGGEKLRFGAMSPRLADLAYILAKNNGVEFNIVQVKGGKAVMNGVNAGDLDLGFMAGIQAKGVKSGDLVNLASALSEKLQMSPEAPTFADLNVPFNSDGYFLFAAPAGIPDDARAALTGAIIEAISEQDSKVNKMLVKAFAGASIIKGDDLDAYLQGQVSSTEALMKAASE